MKNYNSYDMLSNCPQDAFNFYMVLGPNIANKHTVRLSFSQLYAFIETV